MMAKAYFVFNADQVDGIEKAEPTQDEIRTNMVDVLAEVDSFMLRTKADIRTGMAQAFYNPNGDYINMPERDLFTGSETSSPTETYYSTLCHELTHWTGHAKRLDRLGTCKKGEYAFEELVAELGAAFLCADLGIASLPRPDHAAYIASWLKALKNDSKFIFQAASQAQKALDYVQMIATDGAIDMVDLHNENEIEPMACAA